MGGEREGTILARSPIAPRAASANPAPSPRAAAQ
jgi:hypothetical protein